MGVKGVQRPRLRNVSDNDALIVYFIILKYVFNHEIKILVIAREKSTSKGRWMDKNGRDHYNKT